MKTVLILHGIGGHAGIHWQQWFHDELTRAGYHVLMPELPDADHPDRQIWLDVIRSNLEGVKLADLTVVAHSLGVTSALDFIETAPEKIDGLVSVSGFAKDYGAELNSYFLREKSIDFDAVNRNLQRAAVFYGDDDPYVTQEALQNLAVQLNVTPTVLSKGGHLNTTAGYTTFPELLKFFV